MKNIIIPVIIIFVMATCTNAELLPFRVFGLNTHVQTAGEAISDAAFMTAKAITNLFNSATPPIVTQPTEKYIYFTIPLNPGGSDVYTLSGHKWTDFEIKISKVSNSDEAFNMVYYWQSQGDPWDGNDSEYGDRDARCYFIDDHTTRDVRLWSIYSNLTPGIDVMSLSTQCVSSNSLIDTVIFYPSREGCALDWTTWQSYTNACNLRASWIRYDELGPELNAAGTQRWQPIEIQWSEKRKNEAP